MIESRLFFHCYYRNQSLYQNNSFGLFVIVYIRSANKFTCRLFNVFFAFLFLIIIFKGLALFPIEQWCPNTNKYNFIIKGSADLNEINVLQHGYNNTAFYPEILRVHSDSIEY